MARDSAAISGVSSTVTCVVRPSCAGLWGGHEPGAGAALVLVEWPAHGGRRPTYAGGDACRFEVSEGVGAAQPEVSPAAPGGARPARGCCRSRRATRRVRTARAMSRESPLVLGCLRDR